MCHWELGCADVSFSESIPLNERRKSKTKGTSKFCCSHSPLPSPLQCSRVSRPCCCWASLPNSASAPADPGAGRVLVPPFRSLPVAAEKVPAASEQTLHVMINDTCCPRTSWSCRSGFPESDSSAQTSSGAVAACLSAGARQLLLGGTCWLVAGPSRAQSPQVLRKGTFQRGSVTAGRFLFLWASLPTGTASLFGVENGNSLILRVEQCDIINRSNDNLFTEYQLVFSFLREQRWGMEGRLDDTT